MWVRFVFYKRTLPTGHSESRAATFRHTPAWAGGRVRRQRCGWVRRVGNYRFLFRF